MRTRRRSRHGIVILIILSLLVMIALVALTFAIVAADYNRTAKIIARQKVTGDEPQVELDTAMYQLLRDTRLRSALWGHSLLLDLYGSDGVTGEIIGGITLEGATGQQFLRFNVQNDNPARSPFGRTLNSIPGYYNGQVLTMLDGPARGKSTRIVQYTPSDAGNPNTFLRVEAFDSDLANPVLPNQNDRFLINGRPFNGTGAGYFAQSSGGSGNLDRTYTLTDSGGMNYPAPVALLPHFRAYVSAATFADNVEQGGSDESYDAVDFQNMFLTKHPANATASNNITPSFHRPDLIAYWVNYFQNQSPSPWSDPVFQRALLAKACMRPLPVSMGGHHLNFTGSNAGFTLSTYRYPPGHAAWDDLAPADGIPDLDSNSDGIPDAWDTNDDGVLDTWDVDSDGDGIRDAVWVDLGLPLKTSPDGRMYKPLFAFRVEDLDGKFNLNAHGNLAQLDPPNQVGGPYTMNPSYGAPPLAYFAGGHGVTQLPSATATVPMPRGMGFGPAGVYMGHLFQANAAEYGNILASRYGQDMMNNVPGPGIAGVDDFLSIVKGIGRPANYATSLFTDSGWGSPPDVWDRETVGLDYAGQPIISYYNAAPTQTIDEPYEINLLGDGSEDTGVGDQPYTLAELERLLRFYDHDGGKLPQRLLALASNAFASAANRRRFTTQSMHVPAPNAVAPPELRDGSVDGVQSALQGVLSNSTVANVTIADLLIARLLAGGVPASSIPGQVALMLPFEMQHGQLFDLNRHFGNGVDENVPNDPDAAVDNPSEQAVGELTWPNTGTNFDGRPFDHRNDDPRLGLPGNPVRIRQIYARHLYCLLMLLKPDGVDIDFDGNPGNNSAQETARGLAQWAINVVDFRDVDSIMSAFEYDLTPFDGWSVDDVVGTSTSPSPDDGSPGRGLVWGCERPELLITESLAVHDRRTQDLDNEQPDNNEQPATVTDPTNPDDDFDQRLRPRGSFFVELYNPWTGVSKRPSELYEGASGGVQLDRRAPPGPSSPIGAPVWRLRIVQGDTALSRDPDQLDPTAADYLPPADIERTVYFTGDPGPSIPAPGANHVNFYRDEATISAISPLRPGHYAVVGSEGMARGGGAFGSFETMFGRITGWVEDGTAALLGYDDTRRLQLRPDPNPNVHQVRMLSNQAATAEPVPADIRPAIAIPIGEPRNLSITEPLNGYAAMGPGGEIWNPAAADGEGAYEPPIDEPLDKGRAGFEPLLQDGTEGAASNFRTVHLQRLADPTLPFDAAANPYITIDTKPIDVTAFNGVADDDDDPDVTGGRINFASLQRGESDTTVLAPNVGYVRNLWRHEGPRPIPAADDAPEPGAPVNHHFPYVLEHTLGFLSTKYGPAYDSTNSPGPGYEGSPYSSGQGGPLGPDRGMDQPFPWLTFNNRPFVSPLELLIVPKSRPSRLLFEYSFGPTAPLTPPPANGPYTQQMGTFNHLLNFLQNDNADAARLYRLFDYVETPSPFVGTERWYNPAVFGGAPVNAGADTFRPPYNRLSRFRDPGRLNLNTVFDEETWNGLIAAFQAMHPNRNGGVSWWDKLQRSRRGHFSGPGIASPAIDFPSEFSNPFRAADAGDLWPIDSQRPPPTGTGQANVRDGVQAGLMRSDPDLAGDLLFRNILGQSPSQFHAQNPQRNPYFAYQGLSRLANMVTTHSNVFAVWITVGYFEVEPIATTAPHYDPLIHADGYQLGQEVGLDRGTVKRHRMFFIIDRSVPVAFEPGENHNVDRAVLLRRFIE